MNDNMRDLILEAMEEAREAWDFEAEEHLWQMLMSLEEEEE